MEVKRLLTKCLLFNFKTFFFNPFDAPSVFEKKMSLVYSIVITLISSLAIVGVWMVPIIDGCDDDAEVVSVISFGIVAAVCLVSYHLFLLHKTKIARLLINVECNVFNYRFEDHNEVTATITYTGLCREEQIKRLTVFLNVFSYGNIFLAGLISVISRIVWNDLKSLSYPSWFPWSTENLVGYLIAEIIETIFACHVGSLSLGNTVYVVLIYLEYRRQYERLRIAINKIPERAAIATELSLIDSQRTKTVCERSNVYSGKFAGYLTECIDHHRTLSMNFEYYRLHFESLFSVEFCECIFVLCLGLHALLEALKHGAAPVTIALLSHLLIGLFSKCYVGEKFSELNNIVTDAIYDLPWYDEQLISNRQLFYIFQMQTQRPYVLKGLHVFPASLFIFAKIMKTTYSLLNIIRAS